MKEWHNFESNYILQEEVENLLTKNKYEKEKNDLLDRPTTLISSKEGMWNYKFFWLCTMLLSLIGRRDFFLLFVKGWCERIVLQKKNKNCYSIKSRRIRVGGLKSTSNFVAVTRSHKH